MKKAKMSWIEPVKYGIDLPYLFIYPGSQIVTKRAQPDRKNLKNGKTISL